MKSIFALSLLIASAAGQTSPPVQIESQVPFLTVSYAGESGGHSRFRITNTSEHAVTAFALLLLPGGSQPVDGRYSCEGQCVRSFSLADNSRPIIRAKGSVERTLDIPADGGVLVAEAVSFVGSSPDARAQRRPPQRHHHTSASLASGFVSTPVSSGIGLYCRGSLLGADLPPGDYQLQIIVTDPQADKKYQTASQWMDFAIVK